MIPTPPPLPKKLPTLSDKRWKKFCCFILIFGSIFIGIGISYTIKKIKNTDIYRESLAFAKDSPEVTKALGTPIKDGYLPTCRFVYSKPSDHAYLEIPLSGPKGDATLYVIATRSSGPWQYNLIKISLDSTKQVITLQTDNTCDDLPQTTGFNIRFSCDGRKI